MPWTEEEIAQCVKGLQRSAGEEHVAAVDWVALGEFLSVAAHLPHGDWAATRDLAAQLSSIVGKPGDSHFRALFRRVLEGGGWDAAAAAVEARAEERMPCRLTRKSVR